MEGCLVRSWGRKEQDFDGRGRGRDRVLLGRKQQLSPHPPRCLCAPQCRVLNSRTVVGVKMRKSSRRVRGWTDAIGQAGARFAPARSFLVPRNSPRVLFRFLTLLSPPALRIQNLGTCPSLRSFVVLLCVSAWLSVLRVIRK